VKDAVKPPKPRRVGYLSRELTDLSFPEIGEHFGGKDHTTVLHSYNKIKTESAANEELKERLEKIKKVIQQ
jgi:chromosomal replication initiator protein